MAYVGSANNVVTNGAGSYLYALKEALAPFSGVGGAGWTVVQSSLGSGSVQAGDVLDTPAKFGAANAWARLQEPVPVSPPPGYIGPREYILQNGAANATSAIIKYSRATGFNTGGSATVAPTTGGGDGQVVIGTGSDAIPAAALLANATGATSYVAAIASDTPSAGIYGGYAWYLLGYTTGPVANVKVVLTEPVTPGSTSSLDQDPTWRFGTGTLSVGTQLDPFWLGGSWYTNQVQGIQYWQAYGIPAAPPSYIRGGQSAFTALRTPSLNTWTYQTANFVQASPYDGREPMYPMLIGQAGVSSVGIGAAVPKGFTTGLATFAATHNLLDTFNLGTADPKIAVYLTANGMVSLAMPWLTGIIPAV
jgi:hypothetical protein